MDKRDIDEYAPCPYCGNGSSYVITNDDGEFGECVKCGKQTYSIPKEKMIFPKSKPIITCPYCGSTHTKKISTTSKVGSAMLWGVFSLGKISKQWHCLECKSDF